MNRNINELKTMILQKNAALDRLRSRKKENKEKIDKEKKELEGLLYQYFKVYKLEQYGRLMV